MTAYNYTVKDTKGKIVDGSRYRQVFCVNSFTGLSFHTLFKWDMTP
jgi:hypothetical protein